MLMMKNLVGVVFLMLMYSNLTNSLYFTPSTIRRASYRSPVQQSINSVGRCHSMTQIKISASRPEVEEEIIVKEDTGLKGKLKTLWAQYGYVAVGTYLTIYITTLGSIFISIDNDLFNSAAIGIDPQAAVKKVCNIVETVTGNKDFPGYVRENPRVGNLAIAWIITKFTEPIRVGLTLAVAPSIGKLFGQVPVEAK